MSIVELKIDESGIAWLGLNSPNSKVNTLGSEMMHALNDAFAQIDSAKALLIYSCKEHQFIAGADINELAVIDSENEALAKSKLGQSIFQRVSDLKIPTLALINGPAMGGGTELALACDWRIITDHPKVVIALPEVRLGILPGWGGTQRLPKLVGFAQAVDMMCTGRSIRGKKCVSMGLADAIVNDAFWREQATAFIQAKIAKPKKRKSPKLGLIGSFLSNTGLGRSLVVKKARQAIEKEGGGQYPAPLKILDILQSSRGLGLAEGLELEAQAFSKLSQTKVSGYLVQLFLSNENAKKRYADIETTAVAHAGVLGAGIMGGGIAWLLSQKGIVVRVKDINWSALSKAFQTAAALCKALVKKRHMQKHEMGVIMNRLSGGLDSLGLRHADVVIEAVVENVEIKRAVLAECEAILSEDCTICTNTSSLCVSAMAGALKDESRFVGMHFFNPVNKMPLVEVIAGPKSAEKHIARIAQLSVRLGKTPVIVQDCPGFLVNRLLMPYMNEAVYCAQDGVDFERIDKLFLKFGMPIGPFLLADEVGIDVCAKVAHNLSDAYGERMKVAPLLNTLAQDLKLLGKKGGKGFYIHTSQKKLLNKEVLRAQRKTQVIKEMSDEDILDRCLLVMVNEAARCLDESIVRSPADLDLAMIMGTGFPPFKGGLLHYADALGGKELIKRMHHLRKQYGARFELAPALLAYAEAGGFYQSTSGQVV